MYSHLFCLSILRLSSSCLSFSVATSSCSASIFFACESTSEYTNFSNICICFFYLSQLLLLFLPSFTSLLFALPLPSPASVSGPYPILPPLFALPSLTAASLFTLFPSSAGLYLLLLGHNLALPCPSPAL